MSAPPKISFAHTQSLAPTHEELVHEKLDLLGDRIDNLQSGIQAQVAAGFVAGAKELLADEEFVAAFSSRMTNQFLVHSGKQASQWLGGRIITAAMIALTGLLIGWLYKNGKI